MHAKPHRDSGLSQENGALAVYGHSEHRHFHFYTGPITKNGLKNNLIDFEKGKKRIGAMRAGLCIGGNGL